MIGRLADNWLTWCMLTNQITATSAGFLTNTNTPVPRAMQ